MAAFVAAPRTRGFRGSMLMLRGRAALTQRQLALLVGVSERAVQVWEAGLGYPSAVSLQRLIGVYLTRHAFSFGRELEEAAALWDMAVAEASRLKSAFDEAWFAALVATLPDASAAQNKPAEWTAQPDSHFDWGEAPAVSEFHGRVSEQQLLGRWLASDACRVIGILGMGGIGKTVLVARVSADISSQYDAVFWRSLRNAPPCADLLADAILFLSERRCVPRHGEEARLRQLLGLLRERRCLVVLDNLETVLESGAACLSYRDGYSGYGALLQSLAETSHQSSLLVTSREAPPELARLEGPGARVRVLRLGGLDEDAAQALLADRGLVGAPSTWGALVQKYAGNALALQVVGELIARVFGGEIAEFFQAGDAVFGDIRRLLQEQVGRLSATERAVLYWLALEREAVDFSTLVADVGPGVPRHDILDALQGLDRRSLLEQGEQDATFTLQGVVLEYATEEIISLGVKEIRGGEPDLLVTHALIKTQASEYVRRSRERMIARPLLERLAAAHPQQAVEALLVNLLERWRGMPPAQQGFGPGNVVNLLRLSRGNLRALDLSRLELRQADLSMVDLQDASLANSRLENALLSQQYAAAASVGLSADGRCLAVGTYAGEVRVWRMADRTPLPLERPPAGPVWGVALSGDAKVLVACGAPGGVWVWRTDGSEPPKLLTADVREIWCTAISEDGRIAAAGAGNGGAWIWDTWTGDCVRMFDCHQGGVRAVELSRDGRTLATGGADGGAAVWDTRTGACLYKVTYRGEMRAVALSADGQAIAVGDADGIVWVTEVRTGEPIARLRGHSGPVLAASLTATGDRLATGGADHTVRVWDTRTWTCQRVLFEHTAGVMGTSLSADGALVASVALDGSARVWETRQGQCLMVSKGNVPAAFEVALSRDERVAISGGGDGNVRVWDLETGHCVRLPGGHAAGVWAVALSADGDLAVSGSLDGSIRVLSIPEGECRHVLKGHTLGVCSVALSPDRRLVASGGFEGALRLWDVETGEAVMHQQCGLAGVRCVRFADRGDLLASAELDGTLRVWDVRTHECLTSVKCDGGDVRALATSTEGHVLVVGHLSGEVHVRDTRSGQPVRTIQAQTRGLRALAMSASGEVIVSGGVDGTLGVWETSTGVQRAVLPGHSAEVWGVALSTDGRLVISGGLDGTVRVWDLQRGGVEVMTMRPDRPYERMDISGLSGITDIDRDALVALGAQAG
jgi:WD40 repeat protein/transcriptional regulator with XRE-family HTH domain